MGATAFVVRTPNLTEVIRALDTALNAPSDAPPPSVHSDTTEHHERVLRQLERQVAMNAAFAHRSSMHASMLSVVAGMSESLTRRQSAKDAAPDILASLLEASGVSMGALFETNAVATEQGSPTLDNLTLRARISCPREHSVFCGDPAGTFIAHEERYSVIDRCSTDHLCAPDFDKGRAFCIRRDVRRYLGVTYLIVSAVIESVVIHLFQKLLSLRVLRVWSREIALQLWQTYQPRLSHKNDQGRHTGIVHQAVAQRSRALFLSIASQLLRRSPRRNQ